MKIAVIGWGSLIPNPRELAIQPNKNWFQDGPMLPIEYARISNGKRLTLVIHKGSKPVRTLWSLMTIADLKQAKENLRSREGMLSTKQIGFVDILNSLNDGFSDKEVVEAIKEWATLKELDAVIWTGLKSNFKDKITKLFGESGRELSIENVKWFFGKLSDEEYESAKNYVLSSPESTSTELRTEIEDLLLC